jgi:NADH:ubiquinone oxidoreductase subunit K
MESLGDVLLFVFGLYKVKPTARNVLLWGIALTLMLLAIGIALVMLRDALHFDTNGDAYILRIWLVGAIISLGCAIVAAVVRVVYRTAFRAAWVFGMYVLFVVGFVNTFAAFAPLLPDVEVPIGRTPPTVWFWVTAVCVIVVYCTVAVAWVSALDYRQSKQNKI